MEFRIGNAKDFVWFNFPEFLYREKTEAPYEWNLVPARISSGAWQGHKIQMNLTTNEILNFLRSIPEVIIQLKGTAKLDSLEDWIHLNVSVNQLGHIEVRGNAKDSDIGNRLEFFIQTDQSFLNHLPSQIKTYISSQKPE